ncbi:MAG TPA: penicillin-binding transpeptidase domain-containing protein [Streptosporangiaceae bacterium]
MNRALRRISLASLIMFVALLINVNYLQGFQSNSLASEPSNSRAFAQKYQYQRGSITTADGVTIAASKPVSGVYKYQRHYTDGPVYAPVTGYDSIFGSTGIEAAEDKLLSGTDPTLTVRNLIDLLTGKQQEGASVQLTINSKAQQAAWNALRAMGKQGAVVAMNPQTGAILAMASYPSYNPNVYTTFNGTQLGNADKALRENQSQPLLNRAINATYHPGSTFKIVTSATAFGTGRYNPNSSVYAPNQLSLPQTTQKLINDSGEACGNGSGHVPLIDAFAQSCNTVFGAIGEHLGSAALKAQAEKFGFNDSHLTIPLPVSPSAFPLINEADFTAYSAIGQFDDQVTPLQEAMLSAAIGDGGKLMKPYLVQTVKASDLTTVQQATPTVLSQAVSPSIAGQVKSMMAQVVQSPIGTAHGIPGILSMSVAAKTGTAQSTINFGLDDAVFTAFSPVANPNIAVGVVIKGGGYGAAAAGPIAVQVIKAYQAYLGRT